MKSRAVLTSSICDRSAPLRARRRWTQNVPTLARSTVSGCSSISRGFPRPASPRRDASPSSPSRRSPRRPGRAGRRRRRRRRRRRSRRDRPRSARPSRLSPHLVIERRIPLESAGDDVDDVRHLALCLGGEGVLVPEAGGDGPGQQEHGGDGEGREGDAHREGLRRGRGLRRVVGGDAAGQGRSRRGAFGRTGPIERAWTSAGGLRVLDLVDPVGDGDDQLGPASRDRPCRGVGHRSRTYHQASGATKPPARSRSAAGGRRSRAAGDAAAGRSEGTRARRPRRRRAGRSRRSPAGHRACGRPGRASWRGSSRRSAGSARARPR